MDHLPPAVSPAKNDEGEFGNANGRSTGHASEAARFEPQFMAAPGYSPEAHACQGARCQSRSKARCRGKRMSFSANPAAATEEAE
jgi:hypothetical protein